MAQKIYIEEIRFRAGSTPRDDGLHLRIPNVTVLVGPNNSGKSQTLRELESWCKGQNNNLKVVENVRLALPDTFEDLREMLEPHLSDPPPQQLPQPDHIWVARPALNIGEAQFHQQVNESSLRSWFDNKDIKRLGPTFIRLFTLRLDGRSRFDLVQPKDSGPLDERPTNHLWALFQDDEARERVRAFTEEAFGKYFVVDPTGMTKFRVRLSERKPRTKKEEQGLDVESRSFHKSAPLITDLGDGVCASVGLVSAVMSLPDKILLIDEPEAFLHPTLARRVGKVLSQTARDREASLVVATHSSEFLMGCIQTVPELRIVRLTYLGGIPTARSIEPSLVMDLMKDPLLRSSNALRSLFHRGVVVTEADPDRAFYDEINQRLLQRGDGIEDAFFTNAQNWQTIVRIVEPMRSLGIPAAGIFDFDVLMDDDFRKIWPLVQLDSVDLSAFQERRRKIKEIMEKKGRTNCKARGLSAFSRANQKLIKDFLKDMASFGIFFVPVGELECWLPSLNIKARKSDKALWLTEVFSKMGSDPKNAGYLMAGKKDVWDFMRSVEKWISDPDRLGIPV